MDTINISLPSRLKSQATELIEKGYFASFSDLVRTGLRKVIKDNEYDLLARDAILEHKKGKSAILSTSKDIDNYLKKL